MPTYLPHIDDAIDSLSGSKSFYAIDLVSGYWQVKVDPVDRDKTSVPFGLHQFV